MVFVNGKPATQPIAAAVDDVKPNEQEATMSNAQLEEVIQKLEDIGARLTAIEARLSKLDGGTEEPDPAELSEADGAAILYLLNGGPNEEDEFDAGANELLGRDE